MSRPVTPSRRTVLRTAAWTAPAVSIAVAAPAFATSTSTGAGTATAGAAGRVVSKKLVRWTLSFTNTGSQSITALNVTFTGVTQVEGLTVVSGATTWTGSGTSSRTYPLSIEPGQTVPLFAEFARGHNLTGTVTAVFSAGSPSTDLATTSASYDPLL
jgi:hypothetical protein